MQAGITVSDCSGLAAAIEIFSREYFQKTVELKAQVTVLITSCIFDSETSVI